jgi:2-methylisocitrate lyase-like PEP mutase family enzyme
MTADPVGITKAARLRAMHTGPQPLILPNIWDAASARSFAEAGFAALATSSSAVAATLGYRDGQTPGDEMFAAIGRIARSVNVPVTADIESGYGLMPAELVDRLADCGVVGCNLEDSDPVTKALVDPNRQAEWLGEVRAAAGPELVINARVDVYVHPPAAHQAASGHDRAADDADDADDRDPVTADAVARASAYLAAGSDCIYPILAPPAALGRLVERIAGPVNALYVPGGPGFAALAALGVVRITFGGGLHARAAQFVRDMAREVVAEAAGSTR